MHSSNTHITCILYTKGGSFRAGAASAEVLEAQTHFCIVLTQHRPSHRIEQMGKGCCCPMGRLGSPRLLCYEPGRNWLKWPTCQVWLLVLREVAGLDVVTESARLVSLLASAWPRVVLVLHAMWCARVCPPIIVAAANSVSCAHGLPGCRADPDIHMGARSAACAARAVMLSAAGASLKRKVG